MRNQSCPDAVRLADFLAGKLPEPEIDGVSRHLEACESCQSAVDLLEERPVPDSLTCELTQPSDEARFEAEPELHVALERVMRAGAPPSSPPTPADALPAMIDEYQILERLGQGGMGTVYKAVHVRLHKTVAIKVLRADRMGDGDAAKRFQREMKALGTLDHENIVTAFDAGEADGVLYLVMKYVDGLDLAALVRVIGRLPVADACKLVRQAAMALDYANRRGLVHRDLKPSNLVLDLDGRVSLLDLGLALFQGDRHAGAAAGTEPLQGVEETGDGLTTARQVIGTTDYMAPEQFEGSHDVDIRADIYSLGCTLYELLAGTAPFSGPEYATPLDKREGHLLRMAPPLAERRPDVPTAVLTVIHRTLRKRTDERYSNPKELADALAPFAADARLRELCGRARCGAETKELGVTRETSAWSKPFAGFANVKAPPSAFGRAAGNPFRSDRGSRYRYRGRMVGVVAGLLILAGGYYALRPEPPSRVVKLGQKAIDVDERQRPSPRKRSADPAAGRVESNALPPDQIDLPPTVNPRAPLVNLLNTPEKKAPLPSADQLTAARRAAKDKFQQELQAAKIPEQLLIIARKSQRAALDAKPDSAERYALLDLARELAAEAGSSKVAFEAIDGLAKWFEIKELELRLETLEVATKAPTSPTGKAAEKEQFESAKDLIETCVAIDRFQEALRATALAQAAARNLRDQDPGLVKQIAEEKKDLEKLAKAYAGIKDDLERLKADAG
ncbi:MAG TPA: serine/threonine-protein kinase, partial [Pirellulales bacterium]|nr:serine/threonine-protein kinase [Pirellulales bacterium]